MSPGEKRVDSRNSLATVAPEGGRLPARGGRRAVVDCRRLGDRFVLRGHHPSACRSRRRDFASGRPERAASDLDVAGLRSKGRASHASRLRPASSARGSLPVVPADRRRSLGDRADAGRRRSGDVGVPAKPGNTPLDVRSCTADRGRSAVPRAGDRTAVQVQDASRSRRDGFRENVASALGGVAAVAA